jgi:hypothetical protein
MNSIQCKRKRRIQTNTFSSARFHKIKNSSPLAVLTNLAKYGNIITIVKSMNIIKPCQAMEGGYGTVISQPTVFIA